LSHLLPGGTSSGPVFHARIKKAGSAKVTDSGLWAFDANGKVRLLLKVGDSVLFDGQSRFVADLKLSSGGATSGTTRSFSQTNSLALRVTFEGHTQAILRIDLP
jgi:hypothetical protein